MKELCTDEFRDLILMANFLTHQAVTELDELLKSILALTTRAGECCIRGSFEGQRFTHSALEGEGKTTSQRSCGKSNSEERGDPKPSV